MVRCLIGLHIGCHLILLVHVPLRPVQQRELTCKVVDALGVAVGKAQDTVRLHQRNGGENIVGDVAAAVHDDIGRDLTQAVQQLYHLLLRKWRSAVLVLPFEQPQYRKAAVALKGDKVMLDEVLADTGGCQDAGKRAIALQSVRGTDARQHGSGHVTEQKDDIFLPGGEHFCDLHRRYCLSAAGAAPDRQHTAAVILLLRFLCVALKDAGLSEIHPVTSLSGVAAAGSATSPSSMGSSSGSAYNSSMSLSCASMNCFAPSAVPR